ncbi:DUF2845 domain-containing protein [Legionella dresdenensis]|uniref:DUF2845 domain-containing protein n=1 Tax=Legionella dresdenensis TaxID=450200 RepID=A0ABV8CE16_9GAMM
MKQRMAITALMLLPCFLWAAQSIYCPQNHGYINVGMTEAQVVAACGQPLSKQESNKPVMVQVPMLQLYFNNQGANRAFYGVWAIPIGIGNPNRSGYKPFGGNSGGGVKVETDIVDNKVKAIRINGTDVNAFSVCRGTNIQVGDQVGMVYGACGTPSLINRTFIYQPVPSRNKPQIWVYQASQYQSPMSLTFVDGKLQSID